MGRRTVPAQNYVVCDHCKEETLKGTAGDGWFHHNSEHGLPPHEFAVCPKCLPEFKLWLGMPSRGIY